LPFARGRGEKVENAGILQFLSSLTQSVVGSSETCSPCCCSLDAAMLRSTTVL
jgi:hypothetical protein